MIPEEKFTICKVSNLLPPKDKEDGLPLRPLFRGVSHRFLPSDWTILFVFRALKNYTTPHQRIYFKPTVLYVRTDKSLLLLSGEYDEKVVENPWLGQPGKGRENGVVPNSRRIPYSTPSTRFYRLWWRFLLFVVHVLDGKRRLCFQRNRYGYVMWCMRFMTEYPGLWSKGVKVLLVGYDVQN